MEGEIAMSLVLLIGLLLMTVWLTNGLVLFPLQLFHLPDLPRWLDWIVVVALLSWAIGD